MPGGCRRHRLSPRRVARGARRADRRGPAGRSRVHRRRPQRGHRPRRLGARAGAASPASSCCTTPSISPTSRASPTSSSARYPGVTIAYPRRAFPGQRQAPSPGGVRPGLHDLQRPRRTSRRPARETARPLRPSAHEVASALAARSRGHAGRRRGASRRARSPASPPPLRELEIVLSGRNDNYGGEDFHERMLTVAAFNHERLVEAGVPHRFTLVEWNPPDGRPPLDRSAARAAAVVASVVGREPGLARLVSGEPAAPVHGVLRQERRHPARHRRLDPDHQQRRVPRARDRRAAREGPARCRARCIARRASISIAQMPRDGVTWDRSRIRGTCFAASIPSRPT